MFRKCYRDQLVIFILVVISCFVGITYGRYTGQYRQAHVIDQLKKDKAVAEQRVNVLSQELPKLRAQLDKMSTIQEEIGKLRADLNQLKSPAP